MTAATVSLGDVAVIERSSVKPEEIQDGETYVGLENITASGEFLNVSHVSAGELKSNKFAFDEDHVLYGKLRPYLSKIAAPSFAGVCSTDILPIRPGPKVDRRYLLHFLRTPPMVAHASKLAVGINLPRLSPKTLENFSIPLPPIEEQRRIAEILDAVDSLRAKRREAIAKLDELTQSIFMGMFGDPVGNERSWPLMRMADVCIKIQIGPFGSLLHKSDYVANGVPIVNPMHIVDGKIEPQLDQTVSKKKQSDLASYWLQQNDVVMGRRGEMGRCAIVGENETGFVCGSGSLYFRPDPDVALPEYIAAALSSRRGRDQLERSAQGVTMPNLNSGIVESFSMGVPPIRLQRRFSAALDRRNEIQARCQRSIDQLDTLFASLQQRAFRGGL